MTASRRTISASVPRGSSLYYSIYYAPRPLQPALHALHAFRQAVTEIPRHVQDRGVANTKLNWWHDELARAYEGTAQHPIGKAISHSLLPLHPVPQETLQQLITAVQTDLDYGLYANFRELSDYCHRTGGAIIELSVAICAAGETPPAEFAHDLGMGFQLFELLRNVRHDLDAGRLYIPETDMQELKVTQADLLKRRMSEPIKQLLELQADRIDDFFTQALNKLPAQHRQRQRSGIVLAQLYLTQLAEIRAADLPLLERSIHLTPTRKLWLAWRTARRQHPHRKNNP